MIKKYEAVGEYPPLPKPALPRGGFPDLFDADQMRAYVDADRAMRAAPQQEPVAWRHSKTLRLYETKAEVPLADGDEWAEPLYLAAPQPAAQQEPVALPFAILDDEMDALRRFDECVRDGQGYDVPKAMMRRLSEIGLVRRITANVYEHTDFGCSVLNGDFNSATPDQPQQAAPVAKGDALTPGLIAAAEHIEGMASGYIEEHARTEPDTGAVVFDRRDAGLEYHSTLIELADDLRQIAARAQTKEGGSHA